MKLTKERICTLIQISYHLTFVGGATTLGNHYLGEIEKTRQVIVQQVDRAEKVVDKVNKTGDNLKNSVNSVSKELKKVRNACRRFKL